MPFAAASPAAPAAIPTAPPQSVLRLAQEARRTVAEQPGEQDAKGEGAEVEPRGAVAKRGPRAGTG